MGTRNRGKLHDSYLDTGFCFISDKVQWKGRKWENIPQKRRNQ